MQAHQFKKFSRFFERKDAHEENHVFLDSQGDLFNVEAAGGNSASEPTNAAASRDEAANLFSSLIPYEIGRAHV